MFVLNTIKLDLYSDSAILNSMIKLKRIMHFSIKLAITCLLLLSYLPKPSMIVCNAKWWSLITTSQVSAKSYAFTPKDFFFLIIHSFVFGMDLDWRWHYHARWSSRTIHMTDKFAGYKLKAVSLLTVLSKPSVYLSNNLFPSQINLLQ